MENGSYRYEILKIDGLRVTRYSAYPVFVLLLLIYVFIMVSNLGIIMKIAMEKALHKPMYLLFCNLPVCDALSASSVLPGLLKDILTESDRYISYVACVIQAFGAHLSSTSSHTILMISLTIRLSHCTSTISNPYCDNPSLFKLSCENLLLNQIFGLLSSVMLWTLSVSCIGLTYIKIAYVCCKNESGTMKRKAIKTCSTHLIVYLILLGCGCTVIILHRFTVYEELRNLASILYHVVPTSLNPVIYGLQTTEIRQGLKLIFQRRKVIPR
ncbi:olfactory receptor 52N5-like [Tachysurus vachellii]|uniref:olfactory receptor 52N5-like n=1 Tax=Tachysurus vachellii TaxID=175792 RepID=UPI00296A970F|nr:olfactory receptor 52N5-like [Tachysurus vachellii]